MVRLLLVALLIGRGASAPPSIQEPVCVAAHLPEGLAPARVDVDLVRRLFLVRQRFWPDGSPARPVNLPAASPLREEFSMAVLGRRVRDLAPYWNDRYFHGTRPPPTLASEEAMLLFLERTPGSVGYLSAEGAEPLPSGVVRLFCFPSLPDPGERRP